MGRRLAGDTEGGAVAALEQEAEEEAQPKTIDRAVDKAAKKAGEGKIGGVPVKGWDFSKTSLPEPTLDKRGKIVKLGEPRYYVNNTQAGGELIAVYKKRGVQRRLVRMLKDKRGPDRALRTQLRKLGVPGA